MTVEFRASLLFVKDVAVSRQFYEGLLGQTVVEDFGECVGFAGGFSIMQRDAISRTIFKKPFSAKVPDATHRFELYFEVKNLEKLRSTLTTADIAAVHDIEEQPWGQRVFRVYDPDGYIVEFGEPMGTFVMRFYKSGMTPEQVSARCHMPLEMVQKIIAAN